MLDIRRLRYFVAICEAGAIARASEALGVAPSALSQHLSDMEAYLGVRLVSRQARGVLPTEAGERLLGHARGLLHNLEQAEADLRSLSRVAGGPVAIGMSFTAMEALALPLMRRVVEHLPQVRLRLVEGLSGNLHQWMASAQLDLALTFLPPTDPSIEAVPVLEEDMVCIGRADLIGPPGPDIAFSDVVEQPLVLPSRSSALRALVADAVLRERLRRQCRLDVESLSALRSAVAEGLGCSVQSYAAIRREAEAGMFSARRIVAPVLSRRLYLLSSRQRMTARAVADVRHQVLDAVHDVRATGLWPSRCLLNVDQASE